MYCPTAAVILFGFALMFLFGSGAAFTESKFYDCAGKEMEAATCENEHSLNKEQSVYNDLLDGLRFACTEYKIT